MPVTRLPQHTALPPDGSSLVTRNLRLERGRTSIRLEQLEWAALDSICEAEGIDRHAFATLIDRDPARREKTLTSRVRSAILNYYIARSGLRVAGASPVPVGNLANAPRGPDASKPGPAASGLEDSRS